MIVPALCVPVHWQMLGNAIWQPLLKMSSRRQDAMDIDQNNETGATRPEDMPPAGPHAKPELTDRDKTPGSGALPDETLDGDIDPGSG
jgi:hypothetical protein